MTSFFWSNHKPENFVALCFFSSSTATPVGTVPNSASFGLVDTGKARLMVTCHHVWNEFKKARSKNPELMFCVCLDRSQPIAIADIDSLFVDEDQRCDLATFNMEPLLEVCVAGGLEFYKLHENPPPRINVGDVLYLVGCPGKGMEHNIDSIGFPRQPIGLQATEVGNFNFYADAANLKKQADDFGGISGCPCFLVRERRPMRLVGFTTGYTGNNMNRMCFTYTKYIKTDGKVSYLD